MHPVHEVLRCETDAPKTVYAGDIRLEHHADDQKSRAQYLPLLELAVEEDPEDDRNMYYLGREYMFRGRWVDAVKTLRRHLSLKRANWEEERCASMRCIARCCGELGQGDEELRWLLRACAECPKAREPWMDLARFCYRREDWHGVIFAARQALKITQRSQSYLSEPEAWGEGPYDLLAIALYCTGDYLHALAMGEEALKRSPMDPRLRQNLKLIRQKNKMR